MAEWCHCPRLPNNPWLGAKVVFDIAAAAKPGDVNKGLERAARLLNLYAAAGLADGDVTVALVLHGDATGAALNDKTYAAHFGTKDNPNLVLLRELKKAGVNPLRLRHWALHYKKFPAEEVADEITIALAALTVVINKQTDGYAVVPVP